MAATSKIEKWLETEMKAGPTKKANDSCIKSKKSRGTRAGFDASIKIDNDQKKTGSVVAR